MDTEDKNRPSKENLFFLKSNIFTRECHSDPQNPGKMICKEFNHSAAYDPLSKENNYSNTKEDMYTLEYPFNFPIISPSLPAPNVEAKNKNEPTRPSLFNKLSNKIKSFFNRKSPQKETKTVESDSKPHFSLDHFGPYHKPFDDIHRFHFQFLKKAYDEFENDSEFFRSDFLGKSTKKSHKRCHNCHCKIQI